MKNKILVLPVFASLLLTFSYSWAGDSAFSRYYNSKTIRQGEGLGPNREKSMKRFLADPEAKGKTVELINQDLNLMLNYWTPLIEDFEKAKAAIVSTSTNTQLIRFYSETSSLMGLLDKFLRSDIAAQVAEGAFAPECTAHVEGMYTTYVDATKNTAEMTTCKEYFRALASYAWIQRDGMKELAAIYNSTLPVFLNDFLFSENKVIGLNLKGRSFGVEHNFGCDKSPITYFLTAIYLTSKDDEHLSALDVAAMKGLFGEQYGKLATVECEKTFWLGEVKYDRSNNTFSDDYKMKDNSNIGKQILLTMNPLACAGDVSCVRHIMGEHRENESNAKGQKQRVIKFLRGE